MKPRGVLAVGLIWSVLQSGALISFVLLEAPVAQADLLGIHFRAGFQIAIWIIFGVSILAGYLVADVRQAVKALLLSQVVAFVILSSVRVALSTGPFFSPSGELLSASLAIAEFFLGVFGSLLGSLFSDWLRPPRPRAVGWKFYGVGLVTNSVAAFIAIAPPSSIDVFPLLLGSWTLLVMAALIVSGVLFMVLGFARKDSLSSDVMGMFVLAAVLVTGFIAISMGFAQSVYALSTNPGLCFADFCAGQAYDFLVALSLLAASLSVPLGTLLGCLESRQTVGIAETLG